MLKVLLWLLIIGGVYTYYKWRAALRARHLAELEEQRRRREIIDIEAEVVDTNNSTL